MAAPAKKRARTTWLGPMLSAGFGAGATALGYGALAPYASAFGGFLGQKFKDITGYGAYTVRKNSLMSGDVPSVGNSSRIEGGLTISHREYLGDVISSATAGHFSTNTFVINPGNPQTWEWLSQIACNYEQWVPEGILFFYKSTSSNALNSINTNLGTVIMATQYDPFATDFTNKATMQAYEYSTAGCPSGDMIHMIECDPNQNPISVLDVRNPMSASGDPRFADLGIFTIATDGIQGTSVPLGELWITYQVTLLKPKLYASLGRFNDYFRLSSPVGTSLNRKDDGALGHMIDSWISPASTITMYRQPDTQLFCTADGFTCGRLDSQGLCIVTGSGSMTITIYWPRYAFPVSYHVSYELELMAPLGAVAIALTHHGVDALTPPETLWKEHSPAYSLDNCSNHNVDLGVKVPGQKMWPYEGAAERAYSSFHVPQNGNREIKWNTLTIHQIPDNQVVNDHVNP